MTHGPDHWSKALRMSEKKTWIPCRSFRSVSRDDKTTLPTASRENGAERSRKSDGVARCNHSHGSFGKARMRAKKKKGWRLIIPPNERSGKRNDSLCWFWQDLRRFSGSSSRRAVRMQMDVDELAFLIATDRVDILREAAALHVDATPHHAGLTGWLQVLTYTSDRRQRHKSVSMP